MMFATSIDDSQLTKRRETIPKCLDKSKTLLPIDYEPSNYSIICGNKRKYFNSPGNCRLRVIVQSYIDQYGRADGKSEKGYIVSKVMNLIRDACPVGAFVTFEDGRWWQVSERTSREKVGSYFRDCLSMKYASSAKNKIARRKTKRDETKKDPQATSCTAVTSEDVAILTPFQFRELQGIQSTHHHGDISGLPASSFSDAQHRVSNFMLQQNHLQFTQQYIPQSTFFVIEDEDSSSISSGSSASFFDVDDLCHVPLEL